MPFVCLCVPIHFLSLTQSLASPSLTRYIATDVNPAAVAATELTAVENGVVGLRAVQSDLVTEVADIITGRVDVLLFNPPYVVTPASEVGTTDIAAAWAGGVDGREVTDRLLPLVPALLTPVTGRFYLVAIDENLKHGEPGEFHDRRYTTVAPTEGQVGFGWCVKSVHRCEHG